MGIILNEHWKDYLKIELKQKYAKELFNFIYKEKKSKNIYPANNKIFSCFNSLPLYKVKIVIVGQDPYASKGQANGLYPNHA